MLSLSDVMEAFADERSVSAADVDPDALATRVWTMTYGAAGCIADYTEIHETRQDAVESATVLYGEDAPRGFRAALVRDGIAAADEIGLYRVEVSRVLLKDLL